MQQKFTRFSRASTSRLASTSDWRSTLRLALLLFFVMGYGQSSLAQLKITYPISRQIVQRNNTNQATVQIAGSYSQPFERIEARVVARAAGQGSSSDWSVLQNNPSNGQFSGTVVVQGGWYTIQVRGVNGGAVVATDELDRFGVGEVFAIMGHSNAQGSGCTINGVNECPTTDGASDDRVNVIGLDMDSAPFMDYLNTADTKYLPGLAFTQLTKTSGIAPFAKMPWMWGRMADKLVQRLNVPVLLYNAGFGGTNMQQTYWAAYDIPFQHSFVRYSIRMPYANIRNVMNLYVPSTGLRGWLVLHGENDRGNPSDSTLKYYNKVIEKMRIEFNKPDMAYIISISSLFGGPDDNVRLAQYQSINAGNKTFQGPDLDQINARIYRPDGAHYSPLGQQVAGDAWASSITDAYLSAITPYMAEQQPITAIGCAPNNQLSLTQPDGYQALWNTGSADNKLTAGQGTYFARIKTDKAKVYFPPAVVVPESVKAKTPQINTASGLTSICRSSGLTLTSSYAGQNVWSNGSNASSIVATTPGVYTVQAKHAVYGCLSDVVTSTIDLAPTHLKMDIRPSRKVVAVNDTVSFRISVANTSVCDAGKITTENRLPANMTIESVESDRGLGIANADGYGHKLIFGGFSKILAGESVNAGYVVRVKQPGTYVSTTQVITSAGAYGSIAGNGTGNGEDDEAQAEVRTNPDSPIVFASANLYNEPPRNNEADLSLTMKASRLMMAIGQPVTFTLTVSNRGGLTATGVTVVNELPDGLELVSSSPGMTSNGKTIGAGFSQIQAGKSAIVEFTAKVTRVGDFINKAQIQSSDQPDFDSTPGNGYSNGEDDEASIYLPAVDN